MKKKWATKQEIQSYIISFDRLLLLLFCLSPEKKKKPKKNDKIMFLTEKKTNKFRYTPLHLDRCAKDQNNKKTKLLLIHAGSNQNRKKIIAISF
mgnify:CR=1 FL=1